MSVTQPALAPSTLSAVKLSTVESLVFSFLLVICMVQFGGAWYWGATDTSTFGADIYQPLGVPFRYLCWATIAGSTVLYLLNRPYTRLLRTAGPFLPMWVFGLVSGILGIDPVTSIRALLFWLVMALSACVGGLTLRPRLLLQVVFYTLGAMLVVSMVVSVAMPNLGTMIYGGEKVWRGVFAHKNGLGVVAMWTVVVAYLARPTVGNKQAIAVLLVSAICLVLSGSKGSLVVAISAIGYYVLLTILVRLRISTALAATAMTGGIVAASILAILLWIPVTSALGRDPTLTGRTVIWAAYIQHALDSWVLGQGPGSYSSVSAITEKLFQQLQAWGNIHQPHNSFIAAFGDGGLVGLTAYVGGIFYLTFVAPFRYRTPESLACAISGFLLLVGGLVEGRGVYFSSMDMMLVLILRSLAVRANLPDYPYRLGAKSFDNASPPARLR